MATVSSFRCSRAYILWRERERWMKTEIKPSNFGLLVMLGAIGLLILGSLGAEFFTSRFSLLVLLAGMILFLAGWKMLRAAFFSLGLLNVDDPDSCDHLQSDYFPIAITCVPTRYYVAGIGSGTGLARWQYFGYVELFVGGSGGLQRNQVAHDSYGPCGRLRLSRVTPALGPLCARRAYGSHSNLDQCGPNHGGWHPGAPFWPAAAEGFLHEFSGWAIFLIALVLMFGSYWILQTYRKTPEKIS